MGLAKVGGLVVLSAELGRSSDPDAVGLIRQDLVDTISAFMDASFIDPSVAASANVSPASVTNGIASPVASTGSTASAIVTDARAAINKLIAAGIPMRNPYWIMRPATALHIGTLQDTAGAIIFPSIGPGGGTWFNIPVITSTAIPYTVSGGSTITLLDANDIFYAQGSVMLDASENAAVQLDSAPSSGSYQLVSLWQQNLIGIKAVVDANWSVRRSGAITYIDFASY
jgi:HK97 family phage major capsid protein